MEKVYSIVRILNRLARRIDNREMLIEKLLQMVQR